MPGLLVEGVLEVRGRQLEVDDGANLVIALHRLELVQVEPRPLGEGGAVRARLRGRRVAQAVARGLEGPRQLLGCLSDGAFARRGSADAHLVHRYACRPVEDPLPGLVAEVLCHARPPWSESSWSGGRAGVAGRVPRLLFPLVCWTPCAARPASFVATPAASPLAAKGNNLL